MVQYSYVSRKLLLLRNKKEVRKRSSLVKSILMNPEMEEEVI